MDFQEGAVMKKLAFIEALCGWGMIAVVVIAWCHV
jgi:hypothetical protein